MRSPKLRVVLILAADRGASPGAAGSIWCGLVYQYQRTDVKDLCAVLAVELPGVKFVIPSHTRRYWHMRRPEATPRAFSLSMIERS